MITIPKDKEITKELVIEELNNVYSKICCTGKNDKYYKIQRILSKPEFYLLYEFASEEQDNLINSWKFKSEELDQAIDKLIELVNSEE